MCWGYYFDVVCCRFVVCGKGLRHKLSSSDSYISLVTGTPYAINIRIKINIWLYRRRFGTGYPGAVVMVECPCARHISNPTTGLFTQG